MTQDVSPKSYFSRHPQGDLNTHKNMEETPQLELIHTELTDSITEQEAEQEQKEPRRTILHVEKVTMGFGGVPVLHEIDFIVQKGETVAIIGESGCGKTVLLKTLIGLHWPTSGKVLFDNHDLRQLSFFELAAIRTRYGFVFQQAALFDSMTVGENIAFPLVQHTKKSREEIAAIVQKLLGEVGLARQTLSKKPAELSGGMRKRVGFARALALEPELMLYDEPTTGLDPIMSDVINDLMISTREHHSRVTSILVTHDMKSACKVADRIIMLYPLAKLDENTDKTEDKQIIFDGPPNDLETSTDERVWQFLHGIARVN